MESMRALFKPEQANKVDARKGGRKEKDNRVVVQTGRPP